MTGSSLGLSSRDISALLDILQRHIPHEEVWAFGSRVKGTARPFSDLDLVIRRDQPLDARVWAELQYALSESRLPVKVDMVEWARASQPFREIILQDYRVLKPKIA